MLWREGEWAAPAAAAAWGLEPAEEVDMAASSVKMQIIIVVYDLELIDDELMELSVYCRE